MTKPKSQYTYKDARGAIPWKPGDEPAEYSTARLRGRTISPFFKLQLFLRRLWLNVKRRFI
jgi:hypothetical protein